MPHQLANLATTTLASGITAGATSITVTSAAGFPASAPYGVVVQDTLNHIEFMLVTAGAGTTTWTVTRAWEDASRFSAYAFSAGATVRHVLTAGTLGSFFDGSTGHAHDGTAGNGPKLALGSLLGSRCHASASGTQSLSSGVLTALALDTTSRDTDPSGNAQHSNSTNNTRLTCRTAGDFIIGGGCVLAANATGFRWGALRLNGSTVFAGTGFQAPTGAGVAAILSVTDFRVGLAVGDYVEFCAYQDSGGSLSTTTDHGGSRLWWTRDG